MPGDAGTPHIEREYLPEDADDDGGGMLMKAKFIALMLLALPVFAHAQQPVFPYHDIASGNIAINQQHVQQPLSGATVTVCTSVGVGIPCAPLATIYSNNSLALQTNPLTTDANGNFSFWAYPGTYVVTIQVTGFTSYSFTAIISDNTTSGTAAPPTTCSFGERYLNTSTSVLYVCYSTNVWTPIPSISGTITTGDTAKWASGTSVADAGGVAPLISGAITTGDCVKWASGTSIADSGTTGCVGLQVATPAAPTVAVNGTAGTTTYTYFVVAHDNTGGSTLVSASGSTSTGNATLSATNFNAITWTAVTGAASYDVLKTNTATSLALNLACCSVNDTGQATAAYTAPSSNTTAYATQTQPPMANGRYLAREPATSDAMQFVTAGGSDTNDGLSWGTAKLTVAAACAALPLGNSTCTAGSGTVFIAPGFSGTIIASGTTKVAILQSPGNGATWKLSILGQYTGSPASSLLSTLNGCNPQTEWTATQGGTAYPPEAATGCVTAPTGQTNEAHGVGGYATTVSENAVGGYFQGRSLGNNTFASGGGFVVQDVSGLTTGVILEGIDVLVQPINATSAYSRIQGINLSLNAPAATSASQGILCTLKTGTGQWNDCFESSAGATSTFAAAGQQTTSGASSSAVIDLKSRDSGGTAHDNQIFADSTGNFNINSSSGNVFVQHFGVAGEGATLSLAGNTAARTFTFPDATGTVGLVLSGSVAGPTTSLAANSCGDVVTATISGGTTSMTATVSPSADPGTGLGWFAWVSAANTVSVKYCNQTTAAIVPAAATFQIRVIQ